MRADNDNISRWDLISYAARHPIDVVCLVVLFGLGLGLVCWGIGG